MLSQWSSLSQTDTILCMFDRFCHIISGGTWRVVLIFLVYTRLISDKAYLFIVCYYSLHLEIHLSIGASNSHAKVHGLSFTALIVILMWCHHCSTLSGLFQSAKSCDYFSEEGLKHLTLTEQRTRWKLLLEAALCFKPTDSGNVSGLQYETKCCVKTLAQFPPFCSFSRVFSLDNVY